MTPPTSPPPRLRARLAAWRAADPAQAKRLGAVGKFFAAMLVLTLVARAIAGAGMPQVTLTQAAAGSITQSATAAGSIAVQGSAPLQVPAGLLVTEVAVTPGQTVQAGQVIARFDADALALALAAKQAELAQMQTTAARLTDPETADDFTLQQAQQQLLRAYAATEKTWQQGEDAVAKARAERDAAQSALAALQNQPPATPESAAADRQQQIAAAQAALDAAEDAARANQANRAQAAWPPPAPC